VSHTAVHKRKNTPLWSPFVVGVFPLSLIRGGKRGNDQEVTGPYVSVLTTPLCTQHSSRYQPPLPPLPFPHDRQRKTVKLTLSNNNTLRKTPAKPFRIRPLYVFSVLPISHAHSFSPPYPFSSITHLGSATHFLSPIHKESGRELPRKKSHSAPAPTEGMFEFVDDGLDPSGKISNANLTILIVDQLGGPEQAMLRTNQRGEGLTRVFVFIFGWLPFFCFVFDHGLLSSSPQPISLCQLFSFLFLILRSLFYREKSMRARVDLSCWFESGILPARLRKSKAKD